jgi:hypothetical protein
MSLGMVEDSDGSLWVKALSGLYHLKEHSCEQIGEDEGYPGGLPAALLVDGNETVWVKAPSGALLFRKKGEQRFELFGHVSGPSAKPILVTMTFTCLLLCFIDESCCCV